MNASDTFENEFLKLLFQNIAVAGIGDAAGLQPSAVAGNLYLRLCTDATVCDDATVGTEAAYTGYVAKGIAVPRSAAQWDITGNVASNIAELLFGDCTAVPQNIKYIELWRNNTGSTLADRIAWKEFGEVIAMIVGMTPRFKAGTIQFTFD